MATIGWYIFVFALVRLFISFLNWACRLYLPDVKESAPVPLVSVLIPARNEEYNILNILNDLLSFDYPSIEIIVYDDQSDDKTAEVVELLSERLPHLRLIKGKAPEKGWLGKNYACHQLAKEAKGELLLFLDADVRVNNGLLEKAVYYIKKNDLKLLSIFPKQILPSLGSRMSVPIMNWILLSLLLLPLVRLTNIRSLSAANGQFMMFDAITYHTIQPHSLCRHNRVEDIAITKVFKKHKLKRATLLGEEDIRCLMYTTLKEAVEGFSKNVFQFFGGSRLLTVLFGIVTTIGPFWVFFFNSVRSGIIYLLIIVLIRFFTSLASRQKVGWNILLMISQQIVFLRIIGKAILSTKQKEILWKGRNIYG